ncbi:hypothetical protein LTR08_008250 [Meristemomyces frigidus]|nr:hypothetical protein LTR08_008250 [Meristemomyces frigidus]
MADLQPNEYPIPYYNNAANPNAQESKTSASEGDKRTGSADERQDTPATEDYGSDTHQAEGRLPNPTLETEHLAQELDADAQRFMLEDDITPKQLEIFQEGRDSLAQMDGAIEFNSDTLQRADSVLQQHDSTPRAGGKGRKRKVQADEGGDGRGSVLKKANRGRSKRPDDNYVPRTRTTPKKTHAVRGVPFTPVSMAAPTSPFSSMSVAFGGSDAGTEQLSETTPAGDIERLPKEMTAVDIEQLAEMAVQFATSVVQLASTFDQSTKPYAQKKAAELRMAQSEIAALVEKLAAGGGGKRSQSEPEPAYETPSYVIVADQLYEREIERRKAAESGQDPKLVLTTPVLVRSSEQTYAPPDAELVAQLRASMTPSQAAEAVALLGLTASITKERALDTQDHFLSSCLACATVMLLLADTDSAGVSTLGRFIVDLCGEDVWRERLTHYLEPPFAEGEDMTTARMLLEDAVAAIGKFDVEASDDLGNIIDSLAWP